MGNAKFYSSKVSAFAVVDGAPLDIAEGLNFDGDFFQMEKVNKDETTTRKGLRDSSYTSVNTSDSARMVTLEWIPGSPAVKIMEGLLSNGKTFNLAVINDSEPAWKFEGESCTISEEPQIAINGKTGFKNYTIKVRCEKSQYFYV